MNNAQESIRTMARNISIALKSNNVEKGVKDSIEAIVFDAFNDSTIEVYNHQLIETIFPLIMETLDKSYARGIYSSLRSILDYNVPEEPEPNILDLSAHPENLNINPKCELSELLSKVLNHPELPTELKSIIGNGITDIGGDSESLNEFMDSPKVIHEYLFGGAK